MKKTSKLALCGVISGITVVLMLFSGLIPFATLAVPALAGMMLVVVLIEGGIRYGVATYLTTGALCLIITTSVEGALAYICFFGIYPLIQLALYPVKNKIVRALIKHGISNVILLILGIIVINLFGMQYVMIGLEMFSTTTVIIGAVVAFNLVVFLYDRALINVGRFYNFRFKKRYLNKK